MLSPIVYGDPSTIAILRFCGVYFFEIAEETVRFITWRARIV